MICSIDGCSKPMGKRGLCSAHYTRFLRHGDPLKGGTPSGAPLAWFLAHRDHDGDGCLIWPFSRNDSGYGRLWIDGKQVRVARAMCEYKNGPPPSDKHDAAHNCGNGHGGCCHPGHLEWKTRKENLADCVRHGTDNRGEKHYNHKLNSAAVELIRMRPDLSTAALAAGFGVSQSAIQAARSGTTWAWLTPIHQPGDQA